jgi:hypothetical protein
MIAENHILRLATYAWCRVLSLLLFVCCLLNLSITVTRSNATTLQPAEESLTWSVSTPPSDRRDRILDDFTFTVTNSQAFIVINVEKGYFTTPFFD